MASQFGMIGLGTMGRNFVLNIASHDFKVSAYDKNPAQQERLRSESGKLSVYVANNLTDFLADLSSPRRIMLLVPAGAITDAVIDELTPLLSPGDILIDGGNAHFLDTDRRIEKLKPTGIHFTGMGVSGGEEGARLGPSLMPGGDRESYAELRNILEKVAAQTEEGPCVTFVGNGSAGHYTKMVHNGIEYAMMQLISEVFGLLKQANFSNDEISQLFKEWNGSTLQSFLVEITATVLEKKDETGRSLIDLVLDKAKQKGTGMWTSQSAMELNIPIPVIDAAVSMRYISSRKEERIVIGKNRIINSNGFLASKNELANCCRQSLHFGFLLSYAQGLDLLKAASITYHYEIEMTEIVRIWKGGCIIRSVLLNDLQKSYQAQPGLNNILNAADFQNLFQSLRSDCASFLSHAISHHLPAPGFAASLAYYDAMGSSQLPANLVQAQRDFFGAHGYERTDQPGSFHSDWN